MNALTYKNGRGRQNWPWALLFPSFEKVVVRSLAAKESALYVKWGGRILEECLSWSLLTRFCKTGA